MDSETFHNTVGYSKLQFLRLQVHLRFWT